MAKGDDDRAWKKYLRKLISEATQTSIHPNSDRRSWTLSVQGRGSLHWSGQWNERDLPGLGVVLRKLLEERRLIFNKMEAEYERNREAATLPRSGRLSPTKSDLVRKLEADSPGLRADVVARRCKCDVSLVNSIRRKARKGGSAKNRGK